MPGRLVLGPSIEVTEVAAEPTVAPSQDAQLLIRGTKPGGIAELTLTPHGPEINHPVNVYVFYVSPPGSVPADKTPEWFFSSTAPRESLDTRHVNGDFEIHVPNVALGANLVQTILEFST